MRRFLFLSFAVLLSAALAIGGEIDFVQLAAAGGDVFAGGNWNAPRRNNMYDRWEFNTDGTFRFVHVHQGNPIDMGTYRYRYEASNGTISVIRDGDERNTVYTCKFKGKTVTLTRVPTEYDASDPNLQYGQRMGALPVTSVTFTYAR